MNFELLSGLQVNINTIYRQHARDTETSRPNEVDQGAAGKQLELAVSQFQEVLGSHMEEWRLTSWN